MYTDDNNREVKPERTGWRDEALSRRHREYGFDVPAVDLDFLLLEYDNGTPAAIVEHKTWNAPAVYRSAPSIRAITELADRASVPFFIVRYRSSDWFYRAAAVNAKARAVLTVDRLDLSEGQYVALLYEIRGREVPKEVLRRLRRSGEEVVA